MKEVRRCNATSAVVLASLLAKVVSSKPYVFMGSRLLLGRLGTGRSGVGNSFAGAVSSGVGMLAVYTCGVNVPYAVCIWRGRGTRPNGNSWCDDDEKDDDASDKGSGP